MGSGCTFSWVSSYTYALAPENIGLSGYVSLNLRFEEVIRGTPIFGQFSTPLEKPLAIGDLFALVAEIGSTELCPFELAFPLGLAYFLRGKLLATFGVHSFALIFILANLELEVKN